MFFQKSLNGRDLHFLLVYFFFFFAGWLVVAVVMLALFFICSFSLLNFVFISAFVLYQTWWCIIWWWGSSTKRNCLRFTGLEHWRANMRSFVLAYRHTFGMLPIEKHSVHFLNDWKIMLIISTNKTVSTFSFLFSDASETIHWKTHNDAKEMICDSAMFFNAFQITKWNKKSFNIFDVACASDLVYLCIWIVDKSYNNTNGFFLYCTRKFIEKKKFEKNCTHPVTKYASSIEL